MSDSEPTLIQIAETLSRSDLADSFVCAIEARFGYDRLTRNSWWIPKRFRCVHIVYQTTGFLCGDGLEGLLRLDCRDSYPRYLAQLGFHDLAIQIAAYVRSNQAVSQREYNDVEQALFRQSDAIYTSVGNYIAGNIRSFRALLPEVRDSLKYLQRFDPDRYQQWRGEPDRYTDLLNSVTRGLRDGSINLKQAKKMLRNGRG